MFYEQLKQACKNNSTSITAVLKKIGIGTANGTYWKNGSVPSSDIVIQLAEFLDVSTDYLLTGKEKSLPKLELNLDEQELLDNFKNLSEKSKIKIMERVKTLAEIDLEAEKEEKKKAKSIEIHKKPGYIESYTLPASAGIGVDLDACEKIILEVKDAGIINGANFAVKISGDSMEPEFHDGQYALVKTKPQIEQGKIGIFTVNSNGYIKKLGAGELISLNPEYDNIPLHEYDNVRCRGEVIGTLDSEDIISTEEY